MSDNRAADEAAIQAVLVESYKAWEAGDADGMVANYTPDATAIMTGSLRDGRDAIRDSMAMAFEGPLKGTSTYNKQLSLRFVGEDAAIVVSESGILFGGETEVPDERQGERHLGAREAGWPVADRRLPQQPGAGAVTPNGDDRSKSVVDARSPTPPGGDRPHVCTAGDRYLAAAPRSTKGHRRAAGGPRPSLQVT